MLSLNNKESPELNSASENSGSNSGLASASASDMRSIKPISSFVRLCRTLAKGFLQLEFQQLPTSYLRLAAHRVAKHYSLQSMVLLDNSLPDGSGSRIIVQKTTECRLPLVCLADIPVNLPTENSNVVKVAIKQRPQKRHRWSAVTNSHLREGKPFQECRGKEGSEYNRGPWHVYLALLVHPRLQDDLQHASPGISLIEEKSVPEGSHVNIGRSLADSSTEQLEVGQRRSQLVGSSQTIGLLSSGDREVDRKDPDYDRSYDRSYDRYMQWFDHGFGFNGGPYTMQPMYTPALNYNTEFPQLGSVHRPQISTDHQPRPLPQHLPGPWAPPSNSAGISYGHPDSLMVPFNTNPVGARSTSALYMHSSQYPCQHPGMSSMHPHEHVHQSFSQSHQQQPDTSFGLARPR
ncbi:LOW QUALITY PROTEIN: hypothetical protein RJ641_036430 [Dillenia turbinata]|uniref:Uncharacterized protein n=1 Tax=Dillenia turbinata TaxID=194707 RepID=A0AAN8VPR2_9MAGN